MTTRARAGGAEVEASAEAPRRGRARRALLRTLPVLLACAAAGGAGWYFGGDRTWGAFAAALTLTAAVVLRGAWRPAGGTVNAQAAERDAYMTHNRSFTLNAGGLSAVVGAAAIVGLNGLLVAHVSTDVPGGRYYRPSGASGAAAPVLLRDLPSEQIGSTSGFSLQKGGSRISGRQCARSVYQVVSSIGAPSVITVTPTARYARFTALAGMPDEADLRASSEFVLLGDGQRLIARKTASPGRPARFDEDVSSHKTLYLRVALITSRNGTEFGGTYRAVWGDAQLLSAKSRPDVCPTSAGN